MTAQKRAQSIDKVGLSITALTGDQLTQQGVTETSELTKVVPGFNFTQSAYASPVYTIRGVGFQESSLAASPAVSVYVDEVPLPFPIETEAAALDLERVEVLKGPQGTLFGENSTGGAVNYVSAKPTNALQAGADVSFGRFDTTDVSGFLSGPITGTLKARLSLRAIEGGNYQQSYTSSETLGARNQVQGRLLLDWQPIEKLTVKVNLNISQNKSDTPASQVIGISSSAAGVPLTPGLASYPLAPADDRAAGWDPDAQYRRDNIFYQASTREDYDFGDDVMLTAITAYERFTRNQPFDQDGTPFQDVFQRLTGSITTVNQEVRLAGRFGNRGNWLVGGNYESDQVNDNADELIKDSTTANVPGLSFTDELNGTRQDVKTYAAFSNIDFEILPSLTAQAGARYTEADRAYQGCGRDAGDGQLANVVETLQAVVKGPANVVPISPGGCITLGPTLDPGEVNLNLDQSNVSWRTGLSWQLNAATLLYVSISKGYKSGSFPTLGALFSIQDAPVTQESVLSYEGGFKAALLGRTLQVNAATFYYDYTNKQIRGYFDAPLFGALESLINIPKSRVVGFELSTDWHPLPGVTLSPAVTLVNSRIGGNFASLTPLLQTAQLTGESFPDTPEWQAYMNAEYRREISASLDGFFGLNATYQSATDGAVGDVPLFKLKSYTLLDLRAGVESKSGAYRLSLWGRNVTNEFYATYTGRNVDVDHRYAGMPATFGFTLSYRYKS